MKGKLGGRERLGAIWEEGEPSAEGASIVRAKT